MKRKYTKNPNAWIVAMQGSCLFSKSDQTKKALVMTTAIDLITKGQATAEDWRGVFDCVNILEQLLKNPKLAQGETREYIEAKQAVIRGVIERQAANGTRALYPNEIESLRDMAEIWGDMLSQVTHSEYFKAQEAVEQQMSLVVRGVIPRGLTVLEAV